MAGEVIKLAAVKEPHFVYMALGAMMVGVIAQTGMSISFLYLSLMNGATAVLLPSIANVKLLLNTIEACQVTSLGLSPAAWRYIRKISGTRIAKFASQLRHIEFGTSAMSLETKQDVLAMFPHARICDNYGLTESNRSTSLELHDTAHLNSIGKPIADSVCVKVIDGEICVQGRQTMVGYWDAGDKEEAFVDEFVRTGDCGYVSEDGYVYLTGRMKEMINVGGEKVSPAEVEETICRLGVGDCVCVSYPHEMLGETVKAFIFKQRGRFFLFEKAAKPSNKGGHIKWPPLFVIRGNQFLIVIDCEKVVVRFGSLVNNYYLCHWLLIIKVHFME